MHTSQACTGKRLGLRARRDFTDLKEQLWPEQCPTKGLKQAGLPAMCLNVDFSSRLSPSLRLSLSLLPYKVAILKSIEGGGWALSLLSTASTMKPKEPYCYPLKG